MSILFQVLKYFREPEPNLVPEMDDQIDKGLYLAAILGQTELAADGHRFGSLSGRPSLQEGMRVLEEMNEDEDYVLFGGFLDLHLNEVRREVVEGIYKRVAMEL